MSVQGFQHILSGPFSQYLSYSQQIGGELAAHSDLVNKAFQAQLQYLLLASECNQPSQSKQMSLLQPTSECINAVQNFRQKNRSSILFNHLSAISESIPALGWVVSPTPALYVKEMNDAGQFYTNRVLKEWKEKDKMHEEWVKSWVQTLNELQHYVKQHHITGLVWSGSGVARAGMSSALFSERPVSNTADMVPPIDNVKDKSALFAQINQGEITTKSFKKGINDVHTHKNSILRSQLASFKTQNATPQMKSVAHTMPVDKSPNFSRDGKKWLVEYQKGNHSLVVESAEINNVVYMFKCVDSTLQVKCKINSIVIDSCKKSSVVFDTLISSIEFINCQSVQMQVLGKVPTISVDKTDGCQIYLSSDSLDVEIISSKSSEMNVSVPKRNGDYVEYPIPEQFKTTVVPGKGLNTITVQNKD